MYKPFTAATAELTEEQNLDILHLFGFELIYKVLPMCTMETFLFLAKVSFIGGGEHIGEEHIVDSKLHNSCKIIAKTHKYTFTSLPSLWKLSETVCIIQTVTED